MTMKHRCQVSISVLSLLCGVLELSAAFQTSSPTVSRNHGINSIQSPVKSYNRVSFGVTTRAGACACVGHATRLQNSYLDSLSAPSSSSSSPSTSAVNKNNTKGESVIDYTSISKYLIAGVMQLGLFSLSFLTLDKLLTLNNMSVLPSPLTWLIFYAMSLKSRVLNPLNNRRPNAKQATTGKS